MSNENQQSQAPVAAPKQFMESTLDLVLQKISSFEQAGQVRIPANYSPENALRIAWLMIQEVKDLNKNPALSTCTSDSVANALLEMVLQGLNPVKKQCYFIVYGNKLLLQRSYIGNIAISKRVANVKSVKGVPIYKGDVFAYEIDTTTGIKKVTKHEQDFENIDPEQTVGAYALVTDNDGNVCCEVMNMKQIKSAWDMGQAKGNSKAHNGFKDEMACKTVINRALKILIGSSDDADLFEEEVQPVNQFTASVEHQIESNANGAKIKDAIGFTDDPQDSDGAIEFNPQFTANTHNPPDPVTQQVNAEDKQQNSKAPF